MKKLLVMPLICCLMLVARSASAQDFTYNANFVYARADAGVKLPANTYSQWVLSWAPQGNLTSCSIQVDTSSDGVTWTSGGLFASTPCTNPSLTSVRVKGLPQPLTGGYVRINVTALQGNSVVGLNASLQGWSTAF